MATIPRDIGDPFDAGDPFAEQELNEFMCPPNARRIADELGIPGSRASRLFNPAFPGEVNGTLATPDRVDPDRVFERQGLREPGPDEEGIIVPGIGLIKIWSFRDRLFDEDDPDVPEEHRAVWPAATMRVREGQNVHTLMSSRNDMHTIHHHGIEPTPANDGVGHITFDVEDLDYAYQWKAAEAGTYFYHCHVNTVLHFEMGMYGMIIVDPDVNGAPFTTGGPGVTFAGDQMVNYDAEAVWVTDDIERRWHDGAEHGHGGEAGIVCGQFQSILHHDNPRFHLFEPDVFVISGQPPPVRTFDSILGRNPIPAANVSVAPGGTVLLRVLNAAYTNTRYRFPAALQGRVIAADGKSLGRPPFGRYSSPINLADIGHQFKLTTAQRWDILIENAPPGEHIVEMDFHHWITDEIFDFGRLSTSIMVGVG